MQNKISRKHERFTILVKRLQTNLCTFAVRVLLIFGNLNYEERILNLASQILVVFSILVNNLGKG